jgi:hypothetical protein
MSWPMRLMHNYLTSHSLVVPFPLNFLPIPQSGVISPYLNLAIEWVPRARPGPRVTITSHLGFYLAIANALEYTFTL